MDPTIASVQVRAMVAAFAELGLPVDQLFDQVGLTRARVDNPDARLSEEELLQLWLASERAWGDGTLGVRAAARIPFGGFELLDHLVGTASTIGEGFHQLARYAAVASDSVSYAIDDSRPDGDVVVTIVHPYLALMPQGILEYLYAVLVTRFRDYVDERFLPALRLGHAAPATPALYRELLGDVTFDCPTAALHIRRSQWDLANDPAQPRGARRLALDGSRSGLAEVLARHARDVIARIPQKPPDPLEPIRAAIAASLPNPTTLGELAAKCAMSERTLQRAFARAGTTYQEELDRVRQSLASTYLTSSSLSSKEIAYLLGYSDPSAFHRAFKRWTTMTPVEYRQRLPLAER